MNVLFVCTGNTCRSPLAEAIFNSNSILHKGSSAGVSIVPDAKISLNSSFLIKEKLGLDLSQRKAVQLNLEIIKENDLILTMTKNIKDILIYNFPMITDKVFTIAEYLELEFEVSDPYGESLELYIETYNQLEEAINKLVLKITN